MLEAVLCISDHFNSQPLKEADFAKISADTDGHISTHSLTKRLTKSNVFHYINEHISTHSLARRLTILSLTAPPDKAISTHSPARRLTSLYIDRYRRISFQLTASQGG